MPAVRLAAIDFKVKTALLDARFVCGDASRMAPDVRRAFAEIFREQTGASDADAQAWLAGLTATNRYLEDIWAGGA